MINNNIGTIVSWVVALKKAIASHLEKVFHRVACTHTHFSRLFNSSMQFWLARRSSRCSATSLSRTLKGSAHILYTMQCHINVHNHTHSHTHARKWYGRCINCLLLQYKCTAYITMHCIHTPRTMLVQYGDTLKRNIQVDYYELTATNISCMHSGYHPVMSPFVQTINGAAKGDRLASFI